MLYRQGMLLSVDAIERQLGLETRTAEARSSLYAAKELIREIEALPENTDPTDYKKSVKNLLSGYHLDNQRKQKKKSKNGSNSNK